MYWDKAKTESMGAGAASGDLDYVVGQPIDVVRLVYVASGSVTGGTQTVKVEDAGGANSVTIGTFVVPAMSAGEVVYVDVADRTTGPVTASDGSIVYTSGDGPIEVNPGQQFTITQSDVANAQIFIEYIPEGFTGERVDDATEVDFTLA